ncbi:hypothetical protein AB0M39_25830 [Streptomyces sp. NPDC051907]|uniref:hypothetical protein n=1 Tax=Streptomyces sp. NPDC051907 TaxID=3155284 RepID=UPI003432F4B0
MTLNAETPRVVAGAFPEDLEALGSASTVEQTARRREAAARCEPLECGHRDPVDCAAARCGEPTPAEPPADQIDPGDFAQLWAEARSLFFAKDFPPYASPAWRALHPDDPRRLAAALNAAELWRKYGDEEALLQWFRDATAPKPPLWTGRTAAELAEARKHRPPHQLRATPGWPPVAVPGQPGKYLTYTEGRNAA